jgi:hypothetical protein
MKRYNSGEGWWIFIGAVLPMALAVLIAGLFLLQLLGAPVFVACVIGLLVYLWYVFKP